MTNEVIKYSIIIPVKSINHYVYETISSIDKINRDDLEVIVLPNFIESTSLKSKKLKFFATGKVGPAKKRDIAAAQSRGEILVFLDDDSFPKVDFLEYADTFFQDEGVVAIGGPGVTPLEASFFERTSGAVFLSKFTGGAPERYVPSGQVREVDDWPSVNLMVRKKEFLDIGGFDTQYWPGEDSKLCLDLIANTKKKILYVPNMVVWHHRRGSLYEHLKQVSGYGLHRGFFAKMGDKNSMRIKYFIPSIFVSLLFIAILFNLLDIRFAQEFLILLLTTYVAVLIFGYRDIRKYENRAVSSLALCYVFLTHCVYGLSFINGYFKKKLISRLR